MVYPDKQQTEIVDLKKQHSKFTTQIATAEKELDAAKKRINDQQEEIAELYDLQDRLEQYTRKNSLEFHGIPESAIQLHRRGHPKNSGGARGSCQLR